MMIGRRFWENKVQKVSLASIVAAHNEDRAFDRKLSWVVRKEIQNRGVSSNIYPISIDPERRVWRYDLDVQLNTDQNKIVRSGSEDHPTDLPDSLHPSLKPTSARVVKIATTTRYSPAAMSQRVWECFRQYLKTYPTLPPILRVYSRVYSLQPLPSSHLILPRKFMDQEWSRCALVLSQQGILLSSLPNSELQYFLNRVVAWSLQDHVKKNGNFTLARQRDGKIVCTQDGIAVQGLRIFRGTTAAVVFASSSVSQPSSDLGHRKSESEETRHALSPVLMQQKEECTLRALTAHKTSELSELPLKKQKKQTGTKLHSKKGETGTPDPEHIVLQCVKTLGDDEIQALLEKHSNKKKVKDISQFKPTFQFVDGAGATAFVHIPGVEGKSVAIGNVYSLLKKGIKILNQTQLVNTKDDKSNVPKSDSQASDRTPSTTDGKCPRKVRRKNKACVSNAIEVFCSYQLASNAQFVTPEKQLRNLSQEASMQQLTPSLDASEACTNHTTLNTSESPGSELNSYTLGLRLDSRCTVAEEFSLLDVLTEKFGSPPYHPTQQAAPEGENTVSRDIAAEILEFLHSMPVVNAIDLQHSVIRSVRFDYDRIEEAPIAPQIRNFFPDLVPGQPLAVLKDFSIVPVQMLHRCYDPTVQWQEVTIPACSLMPLRRAPILRRFVLALQDGFTQWGCSVHQDALVTRSLELLHAPKKITQGMKLRPFEIPVVGFYLVATSEGDARENKSLSDTQKRIASALRGPKSHFAALSVVKWNEGSSFSDRLESMIQKAVSSDPDMKAFFSNGEDDVLRSRKGGMGFAVVILRQRDDVALLSKFRLFFLQKGLLPMFLPPIGARKIGIVASGLRRTLKERIVSDQLRCFDLHRELPFLSLKQTVLIFGIDACHTRYRSVGAMVLTVLPAKEEPQGENAGVDGERPFMYTTFWLQSEMGSETEYVETAFLELLNSARAHHCNITDIVVLQDGNIYSEAQNIARHIPLGVNFSFLCLHKRNHVRFTHNGKDQANCNKGCVIHDLSPTPIALMRSQTPSFFLQIHDCFLSTARTVQYVAHRLEGITLRELQKLCYVLGHAHALLPTKLPLPVRCAHKLAATAASLLEIDPHFTVNDVHPSLRHSMWFF